MSLLSYWTSLFCIYDRSTTQWIVSSSLTPYLIVNLRTCRRNTAANCCYGIFLSAYISMHAICNMTIITHQNQEIFYTQTTLDWLRLVKSVLSGIAGLLFQLVSIFFNVFLEFRNALSANPVKWFDRHDRLTSCLTRRQALSVWYSNRTFENRKIGFKMSQFDSDRALTLFASFQHSTANHVCIPIIISTQTQSSVKNISPVHDNTAL